MTFDVETHVKPLSDRTPGVMICKILNDTSSDTN